jgi:Transposase
MVGIDWAERHHDVFVMAENGQVLASERIADGLVGVARLHELVSGWAQEPAEVVVGIETDRGDAWMLADLVRTDRHHHRQVPGDSGLAEAIKVLARGHQQLVWARRRQANLLRSAPRVFYPAAVVAFGGDPGSRDAVAVLALAPTPEQGRALSHAELVRCYGRLDVGARSMPAPPASKRRWRAGSWRRRRWWRPRTARWWQPRWRSSPA